MFINLLQTGEEMRHQHMPPSVSHRIVSGLNDFSLSLIFFPMFSCRMGENFQQYFMLTSSCIPGFVNFLASNYEGNIKNLKHIQHFED